jgi:DNA polymerase-3 subunit delta
VKQCLDSKKRISKDTAYYLITRCDAGINNINNELQKLLTFCDEEIYKSDIDRVVSKSLQVITFELSDAIMAHNTEKAMSVLNDLKTVKENAFTIMYLLFSNFDKMLHTKLLRDAPPSEVASQIGVAPFIARKYIDSARGFSEEALVKMVTRVPEIDLAIKEGRCDDWTALEQYVIECIYASR